MNDVSEAFTNAAQAVIDRHIADSQGQQTALRFGDKRYSFHDLAAIANRVGNMLKRLSVTPGRHVAVAVPESPAYVATILGAMKIGAVPVAFTAAIDRAALTGARTATNPAIVVIHQDYMSALELGGTSPNEVVVVGQNPGTYASFLDRVREEPSSLIGARMKTDAAALALFDGSAVQTVKHGELFTIFARKTAVGSSRPLELLQRLASGNEVALG
jgi:acyl-coenzyme A synthetase/AMP-(fatty) acid ligase